MRFCLFAFIVFIVLSCAVSAQECDFSPGCVPNIRECGCGGTQTRYTLCQGGCSDWYPCSVADTETDCDDRFDNDCDNLIDCDDPDCGGEAFCIDADQDGFPLSVDCDDDDNNINPDADELCDLLDNDCDGAVDEGCECAAGQEKECGSDVGECGAGVQVCLQDGTWGPCDAVGPSPEVCDLLDNDCDGAVDEGCDCVDGETRSCGVDTGACEEGVETCVRGSWSACEGAVNPVDEVCGNGVDDNCNGVVDEMCPEEPVPEDEEPVQEEQDGPAQEPGFTRLRERALPGRECIDLDGDGFGIDCVEGPDCDDEDAAVFPGAEEICNDRDDDCDSIVDEHLTRACGVTDVGVCDFGSERCVGGLWQDCDAILPSEEVCGNGLDDDCDGEVDEGCDKDLSDDELALKQCLDIKFGRGGYDWDDYLERYRQTDRFVNVRKSSEISDERTTVKIEIIPVRKMRDVTIFEYIPKFVAHSTDNIRFSVQPEVLRRDPLVAWHFAELDSKTDLSYELVGEVEDAASRSSTITVAEGSAPLERPWFFDILPLLIIPVLGFVFIFVAEAVHRRKG